MSKRAVLRCCASCMWVFKRTPGTDEAGCPQCGFAHYGARYALGSACYRALVTQQPWFDRQLQKRADELRGVIQRAKRATQPPAAPTLPLTTITRTQAAGAGSQPAVNERPHHDL